MKHKIHFLNFHFRPPGLLICILLLFSATALAQEQTPPQEFVIDCGGMSYDNLFVAPVYNSYIECGFNTITQYADNQTKPLLDSLNLHASNMRNETDWIYFYSSAYYSKWEAEEDKQSEFEVGVKHSAGDTATWKGIKCWSTKDITQPVDTLVWGPTYHQEKWYKRWLYIPYIELFNVNFTPRFNMALNIKGTVSPQDSVCRIYVLVKYRKFENNVPDSSDSTYILKEPVTLRVSDFADSGKFKYIYFSENLAERTYKYPSIFYDNGIIPNANKTYLPQIAGTYRDDIWAGQGVQFCIDWLRSDTLCTLYIDNIEVYDNYGWNRYIASPQAVEDSIIAYAQRYTGWSNMKHWLGGHEPHTIDAYTPIKTVASILDTIGAPPLMNTIWADWTLKLNGELQLERYYNTVQPKQLLVENQPVQALYDVVRPFDLEVVRRVLQESYRLTQDKKFYFHIQTYGDKKNGLWNVWRLPKIPEYKALLMLALSHGVNGLVHSQYDSGVESPPYPAIVGLIGPPPEYELDTLWYELRDHSFPRLKGTLGKKLLTLNFTGDFLGLRRHLQEEPDLGFTNTDPTVPKNYLTLSTTTQNPTPSTYHFHAGFFESLNQLGNNHFLLANLITTGYRWVNIDVTDDGSNYINTRFRNIEDINNFDTTFTDEFSIDMIFPPGEGYLFQVAPVVKYGGKLIYNETISNTTTLIDEMIIQNGATLKINSTYNADRDISITAGGKITTTNGGTIKFYNGKNLIVEGAVTISGTPQNKLVLDFLSPSESNGIVINPGGSLTISNCEIKNAGTGILSELNANYLNVQNVDFINCGDNSISIAGQGGEMSPTPVPQISYCTIINSNYGISVSNLSSILVQENEITNTACGIYFSNVTNAQVIGNQIHSNREEYPGIWYFSSGGAIRVNHISGHTAGIHLANSSPTLGSNVITENKYHGLYVGIGSLPYMRMGQFIGNPPIFYATSGYNKIFQNGGYQEIGGPPDNDGSEIYFVRTGAVMDNGCNSIYDDRDPSPPLINTLLLMNCEGHPIYVNAVENYWGSYVSSERFGNMRITYIPYSVAPCPEPQGSADEFVIMTSFGQVIDTIYSVDVEIPELTETEAAYAEAEGYFLNGNLTSAFQIYESIISSSATEEEKYFAYEREYEIGKLAGQSNEFFNQLSNTFAALATNTQDTLNAKILNQFSTLSKVGEQEYETAIGEFDGIIQQNPNTEEAVYAEIDALTAALLIEESDSTLQKGRLGKYLIKSTSDYNQKVDEILRKHFGGNSKENEKELLPTEYTLYQNYPNPFNPTTTIKYDLPNASDVSLIIYDILGRKVKELVNTKQQAGRYEIQFNASSLASGVYIYQLVAEKFISSKKMILLK